MHYWPCLFKITDAGKWSNVHIYILTNQKGISHFTSQWVSTRFWGEKWRSSWLESKMSLFSSPLVSSVLFPPPAVFLSALHSLVLTVSSVFPSQPWELFRSLCPWKRRGTLTTRGWWHVNWGGRACGIGWSGVSGMVSNTLFLSVWCHSICSVPAIIMSRPPLSSLHWPGHIGEMQIIIFFPFSLLVISVVVGPTLILRQKGQYQQTTLVSR